MQCMISHWNLEWKRANSPSGKVMLDQLSSSPRDILCLTESHTDFLPSHHPIFSEADYGYPLTPNRRKVALWSKEPWQDIDDHLPNAPTGRFVAGTTLSPLGPLRVIGICIPWERAHVNTGYKNRVPWQDHITYLETLLTYPDVIVPQMPTVIVGDFNQTIPPRRAPEPARVLLEKLLSRFRLAPRAAPQERMLCHVLTSDHLKASSPALLPKELNGRQLSDHNGENLTLSLIRSC